MIIRCDNCGRFISPKDIETERAHKRLFIKGKDGDSDIFWLDCYLCSSKKLSKESGDNSVSNS